MTTEPNNLEQDIKTKLDNRTITPSASAWDRLDVMLTVAEKPKKRYHLLWVAALFMGIATMGTFFYKSNFIAPTANDNQALEQIVISDSSKTKPTEPAKVQQTVVVMNSRNNEQKIIRKSKQISNKINHNRVSNINQNQIAVNNQPNQSTINLNENTQATVERDNNPTTIAQPVIQDIIKSENNNIVVNANQLLNQVDSEITTEYRTSVFQKISKKYQTAKTAFVERNYKK